MSAEQEAMTKLYDVELVDQLNEDLRNYKEHHGTDDTEEQRT